MGLEGRDVVRAVEREIRDFASSRLKALSASTGNYAIKFVNSQWAATYEKPAPLHISANPALTWGTATYVTPMAFPLSSALYGRIGLVAEYDPSRWKIFDATRPAAQAAYVAWVRAQPAHFELLVTTVHSTYANHFLRNQFREQFQIDCVLFHPDQEADLHTDMGQHVWMAVTDWKTDPNSGQRTIDTGPSRVFDQARFSVLIDEDFDLVEKNGLPIQKSLRRIERITEKIQPYQAIDVPAARSSPSLSAAIIAMHQKNGYVHVYIRP